MNFLEIVDLSKSYNSVKVLENINFSVNQGEFFSILGPSGSGKTTILRLIAGFIFPDSGDIKMEGGSIVHLPPEKREVNIVFQNLALFPMMNVFDNIAFGLKMKKVPKKEIEKKVKEIMEKLNLTGLEKRKINELSGGQRQRVALARCLIMNPKVLLLDEPLSALDKKLKEHMMVELKKLQKKLGTTFIYITHDQNEAMSMSDRIAVINQGRIEQIDTPYNLYKNPKTSFVATFIGENNRFKVKEIKEKFVITEEEIKIPLPLYFTTSNKKNIKEIFIRPEAFEICNSKEKGDLKGIIKSVIFTGPSLKLIVNVKENREILIYHKNNNFVFKEGDIVELRIKADEICAF